MAIKETIRSIKNRLGIAGSLIRFLWMRKLWWLIPSIFILFLLFIFAILFPSSGTVSTLLPFFYTLF